MCLRKGYSFSLWFQFIPCLFNLYDLSSLQLKAKLIFFFILDVINYFFVCVLLC